MRTWRWRRRRWLSGITYFEKFLLWFDCFYPYPPRNPAPRNLFFSDCNVAVGTRGEKCPGGCGGREGGRERNKVLFLLPLFIFFPSFFFVSGFVPVNAIAELHTKWAFVPYSQRARFGGLLHFLAYPESLELVGRSWLASTWFLKSPRGAEHQPTSYLLFGFLWFLHFLGLLEALNALVCK